MFTEANPDKGTETDEYFCVPAGVYSLQKLTPIRGRKRYIIKYGWYKIYKCLQKLTPIRGRKLYLQCITIVSDNSLQKLTPIRGRKLL